MKTLNGICLMAVFGLGSLLSSMEGTATSKEVMGGGPCTVNISLENCGGEKCSSKWVFITAPVPGQKTWAKCDFTGGGGYKVPECNPQPDCTERTTYPVGCDNTGFCVTTFYP